MQPSVGDIIDASGQSPAGCRQDQGQTGMTPHASLERLPRGLHFGLQAVALEPQPQLGALELVGRAIPGEGVQRHVRPRAERPSSEPVRLRG